MCMRARSPCPVAPHIAGLSLLLTRPHLQLLMETHTELYSAGSIIARSGDRADRLMVLVSGLVQSPHHKSAASPYCTSQHVTRPCMLGKFQNPSRPYIGSVLIIQPNSPAAKQPNMTRRQGGGGGRELSEVVIADAIGNLNEQVNINLPGQVDSISQIGPG